MTAAVTRVGGAPPRSRRRCRFGAWLAGLVAVALVLRVVWVVLTAHMPTGISDPSFYLKAGISIADGRGYTTPAGTLTAFFPPGYPYFVGFGVMLARLVGLGAQLPLGIGLLQAVLGAFTVAMVGWAGRCAGGRRVGLVAAGVVALWPNLIVYSAALLSETLFLAAFASFLALLLAALPGDDGGPTGWLLLAAAAVCAGAVVVIRPQAGLLIPPTLFVAWLVGRMPWRTAAAAAAVLLLGAVVVLVPWWARNAALFGQFVPISTNSGVNLCIGFSPSAWGGFSFTPECVAPRSHFEGQEAELEQDGILTSRAVAGALADPGRLPALTWNKLRLAYAVEDDGLRGLESYGDAPVLSAPTRAAVLAVGTGYYWAVMALAAGGVVVMVRRAVGSTRRRLRRVSVVALTLALGTVPIALSFGDPRFKVPIYPLLAVLAAAAVVAVAGRIGSWRAHETRTEAA